MSKHSWTYKKVSDICTKGSTNIVLNKVENNFGDFPLYGATGFIKNIDFFHNDVAYIGVVKDGSGAGRVEIYPAKSSLVGTMQYIFPKDNCNMRYLMYVLRGLSLERFKTGAAIPHIYFRDYSKCSIPVPEMAEQEAIVAELDEINEAIAALQQQVADLDSLAKATFYEMFGDPVTNPHSWPVKKLGDVATSKIGLTYKPTDVNNDGIVVLRSSNIQNSIIDLNDIVRVQAKVPPEKIVRPNDILMCTRNGSFRLVGKVALISNIDEEMTYGAFMTVIRSNYYHYLFQYFKSPSYRLQLGSAKTTTINQITVKMLNELSLPIPPLALQREFAERVEAIEAAKAELSAQIAELQTLLASRMDFWFAPNQPGDP